GDGGAERAREGRRVDRRPRDLPAQVGRREPGDVASGDEDAPRVGPPLAEQDGGEPALAGAARTEDRDELAALRDEIDPAVDPVEDDAAVAGGGAPPAPPPARPRRGAAGARGPAGRGGAGLAAAASA